MKIIINHIIVEFIVIYTAQQIHHVDFIIIITSIMNLLIVQLINVCVQVISIQATDMQIVVQNMP